MYATNIYTQLSVLFWCRVWYKDSNEEQELPEKEQVCLKCDPSVRKWNILMVKWSCGQLTYCAAQK